MNEPRLFWLEQATGIAGEQAVIITNEFSIYAEEVFRDTYKKMKFPLQTKEQSDKYWDMTNKILFDLFRYIRDNEDYSTGEKLYLHTVYLKITIQILSKFQKEHLINSSAKMN